MNTETNEDLLAALRGRREELLREAVKARLHAEDAEDEARRADDAIAIIEDLGNSDG